MGGNSATVIQCERQYDMPNFLQCFYTGNKPFKYLFLYHSCYHFNGIAIEENKCAYRASKQYMLRSSAR